MSNMKISEKKWAARVGKLVEIARRHGEQIICLSDNATAYCFECYDLVANAPGSRAMFSAEELAEGADPDRRLRLTGWRNRKGDLVEDGPWLAVGLRDAGVWDDPLVPQDLRRDPRQEMADALEKRRNALLERLGDSDRAPAETVPVLAAVWAVNRRAKRCRDLAEASHANREYDAAGWYAMMKKGLYDLKAQALSYLFDAGQLQPVGLHRFPDDRWAEVLQGGGYCFHKLCDEPDDVNEDVPSMAHIKAKPVEATEPRHQDAVAAMKAFLCGRPRVAVYEWDDDVS